MAPPSQPLDTFRFRLTVLTAIAFLSLKLYKLPSAPRPVLLATWCFEACIWLWIFALSALAARVERLPAIVFTPLYLAHFAICFGTVYFYDDARVRKYTLVDLDADALDYFRANLDATRGVGLAAGLLAAVCVAALLTRAVRLPGRPLALLALLAVATAAVVTVAARSASFPTPLWKLTEDLLTIARYPGVSKPAGPVTKRSVELLNRAEPGPRKFESPFDRVLVFVMEEVTLRHFLDSRAASPETNFFRRIHPHEHFYSNVFATNMDSYTGVLALLTSRFVPYEAYRGPDLQRYRLLGKKRSMVELFRENGYHAVFASAQVLGEGIVSEMPWDEHLLLSETETKQLSASYLCVNPYRYEDSCEDKVMLPRLYERIEQHPKLFWFMPTAWGHLPEYSLRKQKTDVEYYGEMLDELVAWLEQKGLAEKTLIAVTSDHGIRRRGIDWLASTYQIPLLLYAPGFERLENADLHSQIDFKDILLAGLTGTEKELKGAELTLFIGQTYVSIVGAATPERDYMVIKKRPLAQYTLAHASYDDPSRFDAPPKGKVTPYEVLQLLEDYRAYFQSEALR